MKLKPYDPKVVTDLNILDSFKVTKIDMSNPVASAKYLASYVEPVAEAFSRVVKKLGLAEYYTANTTVVIVRTPDTTDEQVALFEKNLEDEKFNEIKEFFVGELLDFGTCEVFQLVEYLRDVVEGEHNVTMEIYMDFEDNVFKFSIVGADE